MLPYDPQSTSELLRASHIVVVAIESAAFGNLEPGGVMLERRDVRATLRIERVFKGELTVPPDGVVDVAFQVFENSGPRYVAVPGIWSPHQVAPRAHFVIFSAAGSSKDAVAVLSEPSAFRVEPAETAAPEIESVLRSATPGKRLPELIAELAGSQKSFTHLFARYVAWRLRELLFDDLSGFSAVLGEAENSGTSAVFRRIVITEAYDDLMMLDPAPPAFIARLLWGSVSAIASGPGGDIGSRVLGTYVPNLLGLEGGLARKSAADVFENAEKQRQELEEILRNNPQLPGGPRLLTWLGL
jgi:hypothetical protein